MVGKTLGHYEILEPLGKGGMGEVFLGRDPRLDRKVAIKVLPAEFASDPERLARFEQEARAAAALNHPHIAVVYDVGFEDGSSTAEAATDPDMDRSPIPAAGVHYIVQEHLQGESLRQGLDRGALPLDRALDLATEVGEALVAAHKAGIIHRDLKPDNIFVTEEGHAKVLDFGLAKLTEVAPGSDLSMSPTMLGTVAGQVMGTAGYMAPEQAQGAVDIDSRADLFAFGAVLYEMTIGRKAFSGRSIAETLAQIQHEDPAPLAQADPTLPGELQRIVTKSLAKAPAKRYQTAGDLVVDLETLATGVESGIAAPIADPQSAASRNDAGAGRFARQAPLVALAGIVVGAAAVWLAMSTPWSGSGSSSPSAAATAHLPLLLPDGFTLPLTPTNVLAISPDGGMVAYVIDDEPANRLYVQDLRRFSLPPTPVPRSENATIAFFDPTGGRLGFVVGTQDIYRWEIDADTSVSIGSMEGVRGATWGPNETIVIGNSGGGLQTISSDGGGNLEALTVLDSDRGELSHRNPSFLHDGRRVLFNIFVGGLLTNMTIAVASLDTGEIEIVADVRGSFPHYVPSGHLVFNRFPDIYAAPFDAASATVLGTAEAVVAAVHGTYGRSSPRFAVSQAGRVVYQSYQEGRPKELVAVNFQGNVTPIGAEIADLFGVRVSPDGEHVASMRMIDGFHHMWAYELATGRTYNLDQNGHSYTPFAWFPTGNRLAYGSLRADTPGVAQHVYSQALGDPDSELLVQADQPAAGGGKLSQTLRAVDWSSDGEWLLVAGQADGSLDLWAVPINDQGASIPLATTPGSDDAWARLSPDSTWLAYDQSSPDGRRVWTTSFPEGDVRTSISTGGGTQPLISPDGDRIYYRSGRDVMVVEVSPETGVPSGNPTTLFTFEPGLELGYGWDLHPDGDRFFMLLAGPEPPPANRLEIINNWFEELKQRVPTGR